MGQALEQQHSVYLEEFERRAGERSSEPAWLSKRRQAAIERFERLGFPTRRQEAWRNANMHVLGQQHFVLAQSGGTVGSSALAVADAIRLVFVDGRFDSAASALGDLPQGVSIQRLAEAWGDPLLEQYLDRQLDAEHPFAALNTAFAADGVVVHLKAGAVLERPIVLDFARSETAGQAAYPRLLVVAEDNAEARLVEHYRGPADTMYLTCPVTELVIGANAGLEWYKIQEEGDAAFHISCVAVDVARDGRFNGNSVASGGQFARTEVFLRLNGEGADAELNGLYLTGDGQYSDHHTWVEHRVGHCASRQRFKGVLDGKSEAVYDGLVNVAVGAAKTDAQQENRNLLLSKRALAHSNPRLEIFTDDVKAAHGSTVGELDRDALFYLRSRGIGQADAQGLMTYAFAAEQLEPIRVSAVRDYVRELLFARLPGDETVREMV
ncbi:Fe-S cluster assembly protein SufD [Alkalilimnicola ehrlichii]|uniref:Fe-S cluster assembly protein SufD n=1 Tax=Alkalilimnicola ehrlichii TaxID=351052 RepID=A0A3E0X3W6_9GAMM|nr:Fe-S cluster assembly protein SufD [Alkalilimnicola ehrlichii]RFA31061.1 Fe-S cluster assembly protein SufD [Alkalilimnicola ehrlichii]RFA39017.1 Fe-S cluster assembly protein SufD [Alkalilimnicola ehrlichii]